MFWGDLDILLLDLPPGTGDVAISAAHLVPGSELIVVTTPQVASAEVAERAGSLASQLHQRIVGVIENMSYLPCPHCDERIDVFGHGGGIAVADTLSRLTGAPVSTARRGSDRHQTAGVGRRGSSARAIGPRLTPAQQLRKIAEELAGRSRSLAGRQLGLTLQ